MSALSVTSADIATIPTVRPRLYLAGGTEVDGASSSETQMVMTRRGRLALTMSSLMALVIAAVLALSMMGPASADSQVVVQPGQTLSQIAASELPHLSLDRAIVDIQLANQMNTLHVQAGQTLTIP
ncbi:MAG: LysM peptidoglycan-binding domain-containing protein [Ornithinimicrobium sp.]